MVRDDNKIASLLLDRRERYKSRADIVLSPTSTQSVQNIMRICSQHKISVVPIGGNTGLCGGATIDGGVLLSLEKLNQIKPVNTADRCITVGSGSLLYQVQQAAENADLFFPLSLASEGSCQIGGNIAANAGGINVLRYGTMRDLVLG
ncbi:MAG: FAD-binding oxidoreductase, partial [Neisseriaceae bacterium]|nr:FAD-binding oxidoreductase [Neisseriaceae bacterium]